MQYPYPDRIYSWDFYCMLRGILARIVDNPAAVAERDKGVALLSATHSIYQLADLSCDNNNEPSKNAARCFGFTFEGRQHMIVKDLNRDTAWFAMIDTGWPRLKAGYEAWLAPDNFDSAGRQLSRLGFPTSDRAEAATQDR